MAFLEDPIWFSPLNVIHHANELSKVIPDEQKKSKEFRKVVEANATAIMLTGLIAQTGKEYWMQIVDDKEKSPDIRTICYAEKHSEKFDNMEYQDVEVVEYETHSHEPLPEFLARTKFGKRDAYDAETHILCHLGKGAILRLPEDKEELKRQMAAIKPTCPVAFVAPSNPDTTKYKLIQLHPDVRLMTEFNLEEELHKIGSKGYKGVMHFIRGSRKPTEARPEEKYYPFEKIGYKPDTR